MALTEDKVLWLERIANEIRILTIKSLANAGSGHTASPLGLADFFAYMYFYALRHDPKNPQWDERDRFIVSNGHVCPVQYASMSLAGYASPETLEKTMRKLGSQFQGHPHREFLPALETSSGPLGSGLSQLVGMALAQRMDFGKAPGRFFYCLLSDAEMEIGETYEAMMLAGKERIGNIITVVDRNNIQIDGYTEDIMPIEPVLSKWKAFNWHVREVDGHNFQEIDDAIREARSYFVSPSVIVMHTIPGKGVKEFEGKFEWHGKVPNKDEAQMALKELQSIRNMLKPKK